MFQHRHYVALAKMINSAQDRMSADNFTDYVAEWATMLQGTNTRFDTMLPGSSPPNAVTNIQQLRVH